MDESGATFKIGFFGRMSTNSLWEKTNAASDAETAWRSSDIDESYLDSVLTIALKSDSAAATVWAGPVNLKNTDPSGAATIAPSKR